MRSKRGNWSTQELDRLRALYPRISEARVAETLGRSVDSVRRRAAELFAGPRRRGVWTEGEDAQLRESFGAVEVSALALILRRAEAEVSHRVEVLRRLRRRGAWSRQELALLKRAYGSRSDVDLEVCLSRPRAKIAAMAAKLCLSKDKRFGAQAGADSAPMPRWSAQETRKLAVLYPNHSNLEIARLLGRTVASVASKASKLALRKSPTLMVETGRRNVSVRYEP
ncbi:MAG: hypothetical protein AAF628_15300 [Planctomycetota bacterium]